MRKISKTLSIISLLAPVGASALGIGEIKLHSALNQEFEAEIPLLTAAKEMSEIKVGLASPSAFAHAGIDRHFFLSNLRFKPVVRPDGRVVIKVTSSNAVREPYLSFLIEARSPKGRALKEFTVLLDPPESFEQPTAAVLAAPEVKKANKASSRRVATSALTPPSPTSSRQTKSTTAPPSSKKSTPKAGVRSGTYGPTVRNDTLSRIAERVKDDPSISGEQMIVALYEANPEAFYKANVNALKAGTKLKIPPRDAIMRLSRRKAREEINRQYALWIGRSDAGTDAESVEKTAEKRVEKAAEKRVEKSTGKSVEKPVEKTAKSESTSQLKLLTPSEDDAGGAASGGTPDTAAAIQAERAFEMAETLAQENDDLRGRMAELEKQIASMQRLLSLKDDQLASMQIAKQKVKPAQPPETVAILDRGSHKVTPVPEDKSTESPQPAEKVEKPAEPAVKTAVVQKKQPKTPVEQDDWLSERLSDPFYLTAGGSGIVLLAVYMWLFLRRKRAASDEAESILAVSNTERSSEIEEWALPVISEDTSTRSTIPVDGSFLSEFAPSDFDTLESDHQEVDPIAEADVYLAYGRYQQAESLIRQAIEAHPSSSEYKLKLFEIFYAAEDKEAFEGYASELRAENNVPEIQFWERVSEMGREICSHSPLFDLGESTGRLSNDDVAGDHGADEAVDADNVHERDGIDFAEESSDSDVQSMSFAPERSPVNSESKGTEKTAGTVAEEQDFDLNEPLDFEAASYHSQPSEVGVADGLLDYDSSGEPLQLEVSESAEIDEAFNVLPLESDDQDEARGSNQVDIMADSLSFEVGDILPCETESDGDPDEVYASLADMDEIETKLDLAKAYVEMDDDKSAQGILREVLEEGNDEQKDEAEAIVAALNIK